MRITPVELEQQLEVSTPYGAEYVPDMTTVVGRLKHLRHVVEKVPEKQFDIDMVAERTACGTIGCLIGHAAMDRHFNQIGLTLNDYGVLLVDGQYVTHHEASDVVFQLTGRDDSMKLFGSVRQRGEPDGSDFKLAHGLARIDRMIAKYAA